MSAAPAIIEHTSDLSTASQPSSRRMTVMEMAHGLISNGADLGSVKELLAMGRETEAHEARKAFDAAVAEAKAEIPIIGKNATGHNSKKYADFSAYAAALKPILATYGLSYRFRTTQTDKITVTCVLAHKDGHFEENSLSGPSDTTGNKNAIQAIGSTLTYLQRYTLIQALGLAASADDDGKSSDNSPEDDAVVSQEQLTALRKLIEETNTDIVRVCKYWKVEALPDIKAASFEKVMQSIRNSAKQREQA